ncbi:hypothetical protein OAO87_03960 [bacterium]|nr:hypothetical protein [bacterium]
MAAHAPALVEQCCGVGACGPTPAARHPASWTESEKAYRLRYATRQMEAMEGEGSIGWFYWNFKTEQVGSTRLDWAAVARTSCHAMLRRALPPPLATECGVLPLLQSSEDSCRVGRTRVWQPSEWSYLDGASPRGMSS